MKPSKLSSSNPDTSPPPVPEPATLSAGAVPFWRSLAPLARDNGKLRAETAARFQILVETLALAESAGRALDRDGFVIGKGKRPHPAIRVLHSSRWAALQLLADFGLAPADARQHAAAGDNGGDPMFGIQPYGDADYRRALDRLVK
jgi:phage terminase small subunit